MKKIRRNRIIYLVMQLVFFICTLLFFVVLLVCEPYDRIPVGIWCAVCIFMMIQMRRARKNSRTPPSDKK